MAQVWFRSFLALAILAASASIAPALNVTVGQSGATYTTVLDAWNAVRTTFGAHTITLIDNGPSGTGYTETGFPYANIVANQATSINITASPGVSPTIFLSGTAIMFDIAKNSITLRVTGVSNTDRITLNSSAANPIVGFADTAASSINLQNVNLVKGASAAPPFIDFTCQFFSINQLTNVSFSGGLSSSANPILTVGSANSSSASGVAIPLTMTNVDFTAANGNGPRLRIDNLANPNASSCKFGFATSSAGGAAAVQWNQYSGGTNAASSFTARDCQFVSGNANLFGTMGSSTQTVRNFFTLYRPVFTGNCGSILFNIADSKAEVDVLGLNDSNQPVVPKVDLDNIGSSTLSLASMQSGKLTLRYVTGSTNARSINYGGALTANPTVVMEGCLFSGSVGRIVGAGLSGAFGPQLTATNCIFGLGAFSLISATDSRTGLGNYTFTHCTLTGSPIVMIGAKPGDVVAASASIFDGAGATLGVAPGFALTGGAVANIYHDNLGGSSFSGVPGGTIFAAPNLAPSGRLTAASADALGGATGSTAVLDVDAVARPLPAATTRDIGADEASFPPTDLTPNTLSADENAADGTVIGQLSVTDPDDGETMGWELLDDAGGRFALAGATTNGAPMDIEIANTAILDAADGPQFIQVRVTDSESNAYTETIAVTVLDTTQPIIALSGASEISLQCNAAWSDPGAIATDNVDGVFSATIGGDTVDTSPANVGNDFIVSYTASDTAGNAAAPVQRTVHIIDSVPPAISVAGDTLVNIACGVSFVDEGATASDTCDGPLAITVGGDTVPDPTEPGAYTITYAATDGSANYAQAQRTVVVALCPLIVSIVPPASVTATAGDTHTFEVTVEGASGTVNYQWYFQSEFGPAVALQDEDGPALTLTGLATNESGSYYCLVSDATRTESSPPFILEVLPGIPLGGAYSLACVLLLLGIASLCRGAAGNGIR
jgi:hypothetical protein